MEGVVFGFEISLSIFWFLINKTLPKFLVKQWWMLLVRRNSPRLLLNQFLDLGVQLLQLSAAFRGSDRLWKQADEPIFN